MSGTLHTHPINGKDTKKKGNLVCEVYANELIQSNDEKT